MDDQPQTYPLPPKSVLDVRVLPPAIEIGFGVCKPRSAAIEPVDFVVNKVRTLLQYRRPGQIYWNPDCGFGTFAERPVNTADVAAQKLQVIHQAAEVLRT